MIQTWLVIPIALLLNAPVDGDEASSSIEKENRKSQLVGAGPFEVEAVRDISYVPVANGEKPNRKQMLDVYTPKGQSDFPVLFFIHGGGWASGDRKLYIAVGNVFARNGIGTVVISYRLSPEVQHPGHIQDVAKAFAWTQKNIAEYGGDPEQIFVAGQSAGGHLTALLATNTKYLADVDLKP